jgi:hypothetical protein
LPLTVTESFSEPSLKLRGERRRTAISNLLARLAVVALAFVLIWLPRLKRHWAHPHNTARQPIARNSSISDSYRSRSFIGMEAGVRVRPLLITRRGTILLLPWRTFRGVLVKEKLPDSRSRTRTSAWAPEARVPICRSPFQRRAVRVIARQDICLVVRDTDAPRRPGTTPGRASLSARLFPTSNSTRGPHPAQRLSRQRKPSESVPHLCQLASNGV